MRPIAQRVHLALAWLLVASLFVQVFLAGLGVFDTPASFATHRDVGYTLSLLPIVIFVVGLLGGVGRRLGGLAVLIFVLFIVQSVLLAARETYPAVAALHPVNGFVILLLAIVVARDAWAVRGRPLASTT